MSKTVTDTRTDAGPVPVTCTQCGAEVAHGDLLLVVDGYLVRSL